LKNLKSASVLYITMFSQSTNMMDDIVVVPTISLNPKKAKKKLKKAARMHDASEVVQLPVNSAQFVKMVSAPFPAEEPCLAKRTPSRPVRVQPARSPKPQVAAPAPAIAALPVRRSCADEVRAPMAPEKRSWFEITEEEEDDDFLGSVSLRNQAPRWGLAA